MFGKKKKKICGLPLVASLVIGLGVGILTGEYLGYLVIGLGVGGLIMGVTQKDALLKL